MSKPKFSWEAAGSSSLVLKIMDGDREVSWRLGARPTSQSLAKVCRELLSELEKGSVMVVTAPEKPQQSTDVVEDTQMSEEGSAELRAAKARAVDKTGKDWFSNMEAGEELPLYTIGREE